MRGKALDALTRARRLRITPAHAGKRTKKAYCRYIARDHPRACGEKDMDELLEMSEGGSPPRMRGKVELLPERLCNSRITPAHAGKSNLSTKSSRIYRDHPRACGEKVQVGFPRWQKPGSPPRMRGKGARAIATNCCKRITPAHAGKRVCQGFQAVLVQDHPRACGEKLCIGSRCIAAAGSPPRMRGKAISSRVNSHRKRITPAHAGKRRRPPKQTSLKKDHPRACGEKTECKQKASNVKGSPPRMRGKEFLNVAPSVHARITPAHAGKSRPG